MRDVLTENALVLFQYDGYKKEITPFFDLVESCYLPLTFHSSG